jgi:hypothetical protein
MNGYFTADFDHRLRMLVARCSTLEHLILTLTVTVNNLVISTDLSVIFNNMYGTTSPENRIIGYVADQPFYQFNVSHEITQVWQFQGTIGTKIGWVAV